MPLTQSEIIYPQFENIFTPNNKWKSHWEFHRAKNMFLYLQANMRLKQLNH